MKDAQMNPEQQRLSLAATIAVAKKMQHDLPAQTFLLVSDGRDGNYACLSLSNKADRVQLLVNPNCHIRATITPNCIPHELPDELLIKLITELDTAYTPNGKTYNAFDLGDFISRSRTDEDATT